MQGSVDVCVNKTSMLPTVMGYKISGLVIRELEDDLIVLGFVYG